MDTVKISDIFKDGKPYRDFEEGYVFDDFPSRDEIVLSATAQAEGTGFKVTGRVTGELMLECPRCLESFSLPVSVTINEHFVFGRFFIPGGREQQLTSDDFFEVVDEQGDLDLKDLTHQILVMELAEPRFCGRGECRVDEGPASGAD